MGKDASNPLGEKLLAILIDLYADQMGVKIKYEIEERKDDAWES